jgi:hypothetical protein
MKRRRRMLSKKDCPFLTKPLIRERVLRKNVEAPDLATVKDFLRFHAAASKGKIKENTYLKLAAGPVNFLVHGNGVDFFASFAAPSRPHPTLDLIVLFFPEQQSP